MGILQFWFNYLPASLCKAHTTHFCSKAKQTDAPAVSAFTPVSLFVQGDNQASLPIFRCSSMTPGNLTHTTQAKNIFLIQDVQHFRSDFIAIWSLARFDGDNWNTSAVVIGFSYPKCTSPVSGVAIGTRFKGYLKHSLRLLRMNISLLSKTPFEFMMDLVVWDLLQRSARMFRWWLRTFGPQRFKNAMKIRLCFEVMPCINNVWTQYCFCVT